MEASSTCHWGQWLNIVLTYDPLGVSRSLLNFVNILLPCMYTLKCLRTNTEKLAILLADSLTTRARTLNWSPIPEWRENKPTLFCLNCRIISLFLVSKLDATINCKVILPVNRKGQFICSFQPCFVIDSSSISFEPSASSIDEWKGMETAFRLQDLNQQPRVSFPQIQSPNIFSLSSTRWEKKGAETVLSYESLQSMRGFRFSEGKKQTNPPTNKAWILLNLGVKTWSYWQVLITLATTSFSILNKCNMTNLLLVFFSGRNLK